MNKYREMLISLQRKCALRVISAYRTVSAVVVAGLTPFDLLAEERERLYLSENGHSIETRKRQRVMTMARWQERWNQLESVAAWTKLIISVVERWINQRSGCLR